MRQLVLSIFIFAWAAGISYAISFMHGMHKVEFQNDISTVKFNSLQFKEDYAIVHLLTEECGCSQIIAEYLIQRGKIDDVKEFVYFIGQSKEYKQDLEAKGFIIEEIENQFIQGVPMLSIFSKDGELKYSGGYSQSIITPITKIQDKKILSQIKKNISSEKFVVQGCATSKSIIGQIDPLRIKYKR